MMGASLNPGKLKKVGGLSQKVTLNHYKICNTIQPKDQPNRKEGSNKIIKNYENNENLALN